MPTQWAGPFRTLVVTRNPKAAHGPEVEDDACVDRISRHGAEDSTVLGGAPVVAEYEVLVGAEMHDWKWIGGDVVSRASVHVHAFTLTDQGIAGDADHAFIDLQVRGPWLVGTISPPIEPRARNITTSPR